MCGVLYMYVDVVRIARELRATCIENIALNEKYSAIVLIFLFTTRSERVKKVGKVVLEI